MFQMKKKLVYVHLLTSIFIIIVTTGLGYLSPLFDLYHWKMVTILRKSY